MSKYMLFPKKELDVFTVTIVADSNDVDYVTTINKYNKEVFDKYVIDELINLKKYDGRYELEYFETNGISEYLDIPHNDWDYQYCHTLKKVTIEYLDENGKLWDVDLLKNKTKI